MFAALQACHMGIQRMLHLQGPHGQQSQRAPTQVSRAAADLHNSRRESTGRRAHVGGSQSQILRLTSAASPHGLLTLHAAQKWFRAATSMNVTI